MRLSSTTREMSMRARGASCVVTPCPHAATRRARALSRLLGILRANPGRRNAIGPNGRRVNNAMRGSAVRTPVTGSPKRRSADAVHGFDVMHGGRGLMRCAPRAAGRRGPACRRTPTRQFKDTLPPPCRHVRCAPSVAKECRAAIRTEQRQAKTKNGTTYTLDLHHGHAARGRRRRHRRGADPAAARGLPKNPRRVLARHRRRQPDGRSGGPEVGTPLPQARFGLIAERGAQSRRHLRHTDGTNFGSTSVRLSPTASIPCGTFPRPQRHDIGLAGLPVTTNGCNVRVLPAMVALTLLPK